MTLEAILGNFLNRPPVFTPLLPHSFKWTQHSALPVPNGGDFCLERFPSLWDAVSLGDLNSMDVVEF